MAVDARHHDVQQDQARLEGRDSLQGLLAVSRFFRRIIISQRHHHQATKRGIVVHDQNPFGSIVCHLRFL